MFSSLFHLRNSSVLDQQCLQFSKIMEIGLPSLCQLNFIVEVAYFKLLMSEPFISLLDFEFLMFCLILPYS